MKGVIFKCLGELIESNFGKDELIKILKKSGINDSNKIFYPSEDYEDSQVIDIINNLCETQNITLGQAYDAFGEYWVNTFAPKIYGAFMRSAKSSKEFLKKLDSIHVNMTKTMENARPPRFDYNWENENALLLTYKSERGLIDLVISLSRGLCKYYNDDMYIEKISQHQLKIIFKN